VASGFPLDRTHGRARGEKRRKGRGQGLGAPGGTQRFFFFSFCATKSTRERGRSIYFFPHQSCARVELRSGATALFPPFFLPGNRKRIYQNRRLLLRWDASGGEQFQGTHFAPVQGGLGTRLFDSALPHGRGKPRRVGGVFGGQKAPLQGPGARPWSGGEFREFIRRFHFHGRHFGPGVNFFPIFFSGKMRTWGNKKHKFPRFRKAGGTSGCGGLGVHQGKKKNDKKPGLKGGRRGIFVIFTSQKSLAGIQQKLIFWPRPGELFPIFLFGGKRGIPALAGSVHPACAKFR